MTLIERLKMAALMLAWALGPAAVAVVGIKALQAQFPTTDPVLLLLAVAIPEGAVLYAVGMWRRRNHA